MDFSYLIKEIFSLLKGIEEGANRSSEIIKGLRSFSRLDDEAIQFYDIHEGIDSSLVLLQNKIIDKKISVHKDYGDFEGRNTWIARMQEALSSPCGTSIKYLSIDSPSFIDL